MRKTLRIRLTSGVRLNGAPHPAGSEHTLPYHLGLELVRGGRAVEALPEAPAAPPAGTPVAPAPALTTRVLAPTTAPATPPARRR